MTDSCDTCGYTHGPLYICEHYSPERKAELQAATDAYVKQLRDPEWRKKELERAGPLGLFFQDFFAFGGDGE